MSKLEEKLKLLGYKETPSYKNQYMKYVRGETVIIDISNKYNIEGYLSVPSCYIYDECVLERFNEAFDVMQKDLGELKKYESYFN